MGEPPSRLIAVAVGPGDDVAVAVPCSLTVCGADVVARVVDDTVARDAVDALLAEALCAKPETEVGAQPTSKATTTNASSE